MSSARAVGWGLALLALGGCGPKPGAVQAPAAGAGGRLTLETDPARPRSLDPTRFTVRAVDAAGRPETGARVTVDLTMPSMDMGKNTVAVTETAPGIYAGTGRLTMAGEWRATVTARQGAVADTRTVSLGAD